MVRVRSNKLSTLLRIFFPTHNNTRGELPDDATILARQILPRDASPTLSDLSDDDAVNTTPASPVPDRDEETLQNLDLDWADIAARPLRTREYTSTPSDSGMSFPGFARRKPPPVTVSAEGVVEGGGNDSDKENDVMGRRSLEGATASVRGRGVKGAGAARTGRKGLKAKGWKGKEKEVTVADMDTGLATTGRGKKRAAEEAPVASGSGMRRKLRKTTLGESSASNARK
jgi:hypothetical protein